LSVLVPPPCAPRLDTSRTGYFTVRGLLMPAIPPRSRGFDGSCALYYGPLDRASRAIDHVPRYCRYLPSTTCTSAVPTRWCNAVSVGRHPRRTRRSRPCSTMPASSARVRGQLQARQVIYYYSHHHYGVLGSLRASHLTVFLSYYACTNRDWHGIDGRVARVPPNERLRDHHGGKVGRDLIGRRSAGQRGVDS
jgi:hypothetical protein